MADLVDEDQESYHSSSDSDFDGSAVAANADRDSDSEAEDDQTNSVVNSKKTTAGTEEDDHDELASGDEAIVRRAQRKKKRKADDSDDEGGEGGLVKTRAQRAKEKQEKTRLPLASTAGSTIDVEAIWRDMNSGEAKSHIYANQEADQKREVSVVEVPALLRAPPEPETASAEKTITISRTYKFAGEVVTERKEVLASSAEGRLWLEAEAAKAKGSDKNTGLWRPKRRTNPFDISGARENLMMPTSGPKLNVVEKSKMDWAGFVDREGIKDQLDEAGKSKEGYLGRMDFLNRVETNREEEMRAARAQKR